MTTTVKTIKSPQIASIPADRVEPGMVLAEGVVLDVTAGRGVYMFHTPSASPYAGPGETVAVFCQIDQSALEVAREAYGAENTRAGREGA